MAKIKLEKVEGAKQVAKPPAEPQQPRERKPIHPGLDFTKQCLRCGVHLDFRELGFVGGPAPLSQPFAWMAMAFCECGIWTMNQREEIRWLRYASGSVRPGEGEVYAP